MWNRKKSVLRERRTSSPMRHISSPLRRTSSPERRTSSPVRRTSSPVRRTSSPVRRASSSVRRTSSPVALTATNSNVRAQGSGARAGGGAMRRRPNPALRCGRRAASTGGGARAPPTHGANSPASAGVGSGVAGDAAGGRHGRDGAPPGASAQQALPPRLSQCAHGSDPTAAMAAGRNTATGVAGAAECGGGRVAGAVLTITGRLHGGRRARPHCGPATPQGPVH
ncbi:unnamed protein product [Closterium sp. NIES-54]